MAEVQVKCPHCGFVATKTIHPLSNVEFSYPKDPFTICPIITEQLNRGEQVQGPLTLSCPHFRDAAARAHPQ